MYKLACSDLPQLHTYIGRQEKSKVVLTLLSALLGLKGRGSPVKYLLGVGLLGNLLLRSGFLLGVLQA